MSEFDHALSNNALSLN